MSRPVSVGFVVFITVVTVIGATSPAVVAGAANGHVTGTDQTIGERTAVASMSAASQSDVDSRDFDTTTFEIVVHENGSATWTFRYEQRLDGDDDEDEAAARANFRDFAEEFDDQENEFGLYDRFVEQAEQMTNKASDDTDREMEAAEFNRTARIDEQLNPMGIVEMSFVWHGFASTENGTVVVGDVFQGLYITDDQSIVIEPDDGLAFQSAEPDPQYVGTSIENANSVRWSGEREFLNGHPRVILEHPEDTAGAPGNGPVSSVGDGNDGPPWQLLGGAVLVALILGAGFVLYRRRQPPADEDDGTTPPDPTLSYPAGEPDADSSSEPVEQSDPLADDELLTDEDRVLTLIKDNGGRMKQVNIVDETGWSKSKVSMLLSDMEEEGTISKLRVGRENIISLEGFEPEATKSPFDE
ncbi:helix-turn-helix transcriptional regulator [Natrarchaeobius chitinivorans]|uniref:Uncharacterized protein n=1 Tax=Natrarchaeobius chitinivorans TaxID=1679083 RepID=A0A3N6M328_NATCH|nr:helix-turn-helix domain-containing protein [Natrarchaeobius chitinivorans]RQG89581.1 hypothetical protein EA473_21795 [Natrarchaeobius chitinivorans]